MSYLRSKNNKSTDLRVVINPYISRSPGWFDAKGELKKKVRMATNTEGPALQDDTYNAMKLFSIGKYEDETDPKSADLGNVPLKLDRVFQRIDDLDLDLDLTAEAGLGTIWTQGILNPLSFGEAENRSTFFDEDIIVNEALLGDLKDQLAIQTGKSITLSNDYNTIAQRFDTFACKTRKDHMFIADPLRSIFVNGYNSKTARNTDFNFSKDIFWSLKNLYAGITSSYSAVYGNWIRLKDSFADKFVWLPPSGWVTATIAESTTQNFPWSAPAGFNRGTLSNVLELAITPTLKQRDLLYKTNVNPVAYFPGDGYVIFGQKTTFPKPSAFDRINVRRLFLYLEKITKREH